MEDERNTPQEDEEVEAHARRPGAPIEEPGRNALDEDDDEVEAHARRPGAPSEQHFPEPGQHQP